MVQIFGHNGRRLAYIAGAVVLVLVVGWFLAFEPVTRTYVASDVACSYCHVEREYDYKTRLSFSQPHPAELPAGKERAACVDCHLPEGLWAATYTYTHYLSATDMFGHFRDRASERAGDWIPLSAARASRMRDRLFEYDSVTCRSCHIESEIEPKRSRGKKAHANAVESGETCIECHDNMVHRYAEIRDGTFESADAAEE
jgi:nitrate/TMAO reductase-like tetraheme cytochrome c subunit